MKVLEPTTAVTDFVLAAETLVFGVLLLRSQPASTEFAIRLWGFAFLATAVAAATGGAFHGFVESLGSAAPAIWKVTVYAVGITSLLMLSSAVIATTSGAVRTALLVLACAQFAVYAWWMISHSDFKYVVYDYAPAMGIILILQAISLARGSAGSGWIVGGILLSFAGAGVQRSGFSLHRNFNFNDIYHVIQMVAMYLLYRGGIQLRDFRI